MYFGHMHTFLPAFPGCSVPATRPKPSVNQRSTVSVRSDESRRLKELEQIKSQPASLTVAEPGSMLVMSFISRTNSYSSRIESSHLLRGLDERVKLYQN